MTEPAATVLVVEDDPGIAELERGRLEESGYAVVSAATAEEALRAVGRGGIDLVLLDYRLPGGVDGLDFYARIKAAGFDLPVILVTGFSNEATVIQALRVGVRDFVTKSVEYLDYLPEADEVQVILRTTGGRPPAIEPIFTGADVQRFHRLVQQVPVTEELVTYAVRLAAASRSSAISVLTSAAGVSAGPAASPSPAAASAPAALLTERAISRPSPDASATTSPPESTPATVLPVPSASDVKVSRGS